MIELLISHGTSDSLGANLGILLSGISEVLLALGGLIGFIIRYRQGARAEKKEAKEAALKSAQNAATKLEEIYVERIAQYERTIEHLEVAQDVQQKLYEEKITVLQKLNTELFNQVLKGREPT